MHVIRRRVRSLVATSAHLRALVRVPAGFLLYWLAASGWSLAWQIARFALPLIALRSTSSPFRISLVSLALTLPWLLVALPAGALADRLARTIVIRGATAMFAAASVVLAAGVLVDRLPFWLILVLTLLLGAANVQNVIAFSAATADVVPETTLEGANARLTAADTLAEIIGPAIGGVLILAGIVFAPVSGLLLALGVIVLLGALRLRPYRRDVDRERRSPWSGISMLCNDRLLLTITAMACAINFAYSAWSSIFVLFAVAPGPVGLAAGTYGALLTAAGIGGFAGSLLAIPIRRRTGRSSPYLINILVNTVMFGTSALTASPWPIALSLTIGDFGGPGWAVMTLMLQAEHVTIRQRGRVMAAYRFLTFGAMALGAVAGGAGATVWGERPVFALCAGLTLACIVPWWLVVRHAWPDGDQAEHLPSTPTL